MKLMGEFNSEYQVGYITDIGFVSPNKPCIIDEYKMIRIEAKRRSPIGMIKLPEGVTFTLHVLKDDDEEQ